MTYLGPVGETKKKLQERLGDEALQYINNIGIMERKSSRVNTSRRIDTKNRCRSEIILLNNTKHDVNTSYLKLKINQKILQKKIMNLKIVWGMKILHQNMIMDFCGRGNTRLPPNQLEVGPVLGGETKGSDLETVQFRDEQLNQISANNGFVLT